MKKKIVEIHPSLDSLLQSLPQSDDEPMFEDDEPLFEDEPDIESLFQDTIADLILAFGSEYGYMKYHINVHKNMEDRVNDALDDKNNITTLTMSYRGPLILKKGQYYFSPSYDNKFTLSELIVMCYSKSDNLTVNILYDAAKYSKNEIASNLKTQIKHNMCDSISFHYFEKNAGELKRDQEKEEQRIASEQWQERYKRLKQEEEQEKAEYAKQFVFTLSFSCKGYESTLNLSQELLDMKTIQHFINTARFSKQKYPIITKFFYKGEIFPYQTKFLEPVYFMTDTKTQDTSSDQLTFTRLFAMITDVSEDISATIECKKELIPGLMHHFNDSIKFTFIPK